MAAGHYIGRSRPGRLIPTAGHSGPRLSQSERASGAEKVAGAYF